MTVSKDKIVRGLVRYARVYILPNITDNYRMVLDVAVSALEVKPELLDKLLDNEMVVTLLGDNEGGYELDTLQKVLSGVAKQNDYLVITLPSIPLLSKQEKEMRFRESDIDTLMNEIRRA